MLDIKSKYKGITIIVKDAGAKGFWFQLVTRLDVTHEFEHEHYDCGEDALYAARKAVDRVKEGTRRILHGR